MLADFVQETANSPGTSATMQLLGAVEGFRTFASAFADGEATFYTARSGTMWEEGHGTIVHASPDIINRTTVLKNSAGTTTRLNFTGSVVVYCWLPAERNVYTRNDGKILRSIIPDPIGRRLFSTAAVSIPNGVLTAMSFNNQSDSSLGTPLTLPAFIITIPETGWYSVIGRIGFAANATGTRGGYLLVGGSTAVADIKAAFSGGDRTYVSISDQQQYAAGTELQFALYQTSGAALAAGGSTNSQDFLSVQRIRG